MIFDSMKVYLLFDYFLCLYIWSDDYVLFVKSLILWNVGIKFIGILMNGFWFFMLFDIVMCLIIYMKVKL